MTAEDAELFAGFHIPQSDGRIPAGGNQLFSVGTEQSSYHAVGMSPKRSDLPTGMHLPQFDRAVRSNRGKHSTFRNKSNVPGRFTLVMWENRAFTSMRRRGVYQQTTAQKRSQAQQTRGYPSHNSAFLEKGEDKKALSGPGNYQIRFLTL